MVQRETWYMQIQVSWRCFMTEETWSICVLAIKNNASELPKDEGDRRGKRRVWTREVLLLCSVTFVSYGVIIGPERIHVMEFISLLVGMGRALCCICLHYSTVDAMYPTVQPGLVNLETSRLNTGERNWMKPLESTEEFIHNVCANSARHLSMSNLPRPICRFYLIRSSNHRTHYHETTEAVSANLKPKQWLWRNRMLVFNVVWEFLC